jgi:predicted negative regulator of RcsB-dependent stress response
MTELTKEQIKGPDQFQKLSSKLITWTQKNKKVLNLLLGAFLLAGIAFAGWDFWSSKVDAKARVALYDAQKFRQELKEKEEQKKKQESDLEAKKNEKKDAKKVAEKKDEPPVVPVKPEDLKKLREDALAGYSKVIKEFPGTPAAHIAVLHSSQLLVDDNRLDEAEQVFSKAKEPSNRQSVLLGAFLNQKGKIQAHKGDCESAVKTWEKVYTNPALTVWHGDSILKSAICLEKLNQKAKAIELYKKASTEFGESEAGRTAKKWLILTERSQPKG